MTPFHDDNMIQLTCSATGNPPPVVSWQQEDSDGQFVPLEGSGGEWILGRNVIDLEMSEEYYGTYRCMAKNNQGDNHKDYQLSPGGLFCQATSDSLSDSQGLSSSRLSLVPGDREEDRPTETL